MVLGHLKAGSHSGPSDCRSELGWIYLEKTYPKDDADMTFSLARPGLIGDMLGPAVKGIHDGPDAAGGVDSARRLR